MAKRKRYKPESAQQWRGKSYKKGGQPVSTLREESETHEAKGYNSTMATDNDFRRIASHVNEVLFCDSHISIPMPKIEKALRDDYTVNGGVLPMEDDMENIVMPEDGGDPETNKKFANLIALINEQF